MFFLIKVAWNLDEDLTGTIPSLPRLQKLLAGAIGVRGDWGTFEARKIIMKKKGRNHPPTYSLPDQHYHSPYIIIYHHPRQPFLVGFFNSFRKFYIHVGVEKKERIQLGKWILLILQIVHLLHNASQKCVSYPTTYTTITTSLKEKSRSPTSTMARNVNLLM